MCVCDYKLVSAMLRGSLNRSSNACFMPKPNIILGHTIKEPLFPLVPHVAVGILPEQTSHACLDTKGVSIPTAALLTSECGYLHATKHRVSGV